MLKAIGELHCCMATVNIITSVLDFVGVGIDAHGGNPTGFMVWAIASAESLFKTDPDVQDLYAQALAKV